MTPEGVRHTFKREDLVNQIIDMRIRKGFTKVELFEFLTIKLNYCQSYAYEIMRDARNETDSRAVQNFGEDLKEDIERFEHLYQLSIRSGNRMEAKQMLVEICKLKGHYTERMELTVKEFKAKFGSDE